MNKRSIKLSKRCNPFDYTVLLLNLSYDTPVNRTALFFTPNYLIFTYSLDDVLITLGVFLNDILPAK